MDQIQTLLPTLSANELQALHSQIRDLLEDKRVDFLSTLPAEIALIILEFLSVHDLCQNQLVCKRWHQLARDDEVWKRLCHEYRARRWRGTWRAQFIYSWCIRQNWKKGGQLLYSYRLLDLPPANNSNSNWRNSVREALPTITAHTLSPKYTTIALSSGLIHIFRSSNGEYLRTLDHNSMVSSRGVWAVWSVGQGVSGKSRHHTNGSSELLVSGGCDKALKLWDLNTGRRIWKHTGHESTIRAVCVVRNVCISGSRDTTVQLWDLESGGRLHVLRGHTDAVRCLDAEGHTVVSGGYDGQVRVWSMDTGECLNVLHHAAQQIYTVAFDGKYVVSGGSESVVYVWDPHTGHCVAQMVGHDSLISSVQILDLEIEVNGEEKTVPAVISASSRGALIAHSLETFLMLRRDDVGDDTMITSLQADSEYVVCGRADGKVSVWSRHEWHSWQVGGKMQSVSIVAFLNGDEGGMLAIMAKRGGYSVVDFYGMKP